jgi:hypothetical protein
MTADHVDRSSDHASAAALLLSLAAAPAGWIAQLVVSYGVASYACQPTGAPQLRPAGFGWADEHWLLLAVNLACLALTIGAGIAPWRAVRRHLTASSAAPGERKPAGHIQFLAACGLMASVGFAIAIAFNTVELVTVSACWRITG